MAIWELEMSKKVARLLMRNGITTIEELSQKSDESLLQIRGFGSSALCEVKMALKNGISQ